MIGPPNVPPTMYRCSSGFTSREFAAIRGSFLKKNGAAFHALVPRCAYSAPWKPLVPDDVVISMCAPEVVPCSASYIEAFTRTSSIVSGAGVGIALPIEVYTDAADWITPPAPPEVEMPVEFTTRAEPTWLVLLPLNRLLPSTPFRLKLFAVSRCPFAQIGRLPSPSFAPVPLGNSAFTPGDRIATPVKLPVGCGIVSSCVLSST